MVTVIAGVIAPLLQTPPTLPESVTLPPSQNVIAPLAEIADTTGGWSTVTII